MFSQGSGDSTWKTKTKLLTLPVVGGDCVVGGWLGGGGVAIKNQK